MYLLWISWITVLFSPSFFFFFCFVVFFVLLCCLLTSDKNLKKTENKKKKKLPNTLSPTHTHTHTQTVFLFASVCLSAFYHNNVDLIQLPWSSRNCHQLWWLNMTRLPDSVSLCVSVCLSVSLSLSQHTHRYWGRSTFADWKGSWPFLCNSFCVITCRLYIFLL